MKMNKLLPSAVVGSYPQPHWLVDAAALSGRVPRIRAQDIWRVDEAQLVECRVVAQQDNDDRCHQYG